jgi:glucose/arabinose dehydrogenase
LGPNDILVLEKDKGTVQRIIDGKIMPEPILDVNVATNSERGMLGIAAVTAENNPVLDSKPSSSTNTYVFIYFTESGSEEDGNDGCTRPSPNCNQISPPPNGNRLYRYELVEGKLVNPILLLDLPAVPGPAHNGGAISIGPDNNVYIPIGDVKGEDPQKTQSLDGRAGILKVTQNGEAVVLGAENEDKGGEEGEDDKNILESEDDSSFSKYYYAYGIRNSFGIDFDPVTGKLWDTENGPGFGDEINLVEPGFNSGWKEIMGVASLDPGFDPEADLENFDGKGKYSDPEFTWNETVGPTGIKFLNSDKLGAQYQNDIFVGDVHRGNLYHFKLNKDRTGLALDGALADTIANDDTELSTAIFGKGFGGISDIEVGPDGYLYVVSIGLGKIFKIVPKVNDDDNNNGGVVE